MDRRHMRVTSLVSAGRAARMVQRTTTRRGPATTTPRRGATTATRARGATTPTRGPTQRTHRASASVGWTLVVTVTVAAAIAARNKARMVASLLNGCGHY